MQLILVQLLGKKEQIGEKKINVKKKITKPSLHLI